MVERAVLVVSAERTTQIILLMAVCTLKSVRTGSREAEEDEILAMMNGTIMGRRMEGLRWLLIILAEIACSFLQFEVKNLCSAPKLPFLIIGNS